MHTIFDYFKYAQLAQASYALFNDPLKTVQEALETVNAGDFAATQASLFLSQYALLDHEPNADTGFSASVFQSGSGEGAEYVLAIRGTEPGIADIAQTDIADIGANGIAISQAIDLMNYLQRLTAVEGQQLVQYSYVDGPVPGIGGFNLTAGSIAYTTSLASETGVLAGKRFTVTGHSLGGHLALIMGRLAPGLVDAVYTYNAPGFDTGLVPGFDNTEWFFGALAQAQAAATGLPSTVGSFFDMSLATNLVVPTDLVSDIGTAPGTRIAQFHEAADAASAHSIVGMTDSLALQSVLAEFLGPVGLDPALTLEGLDLLIRAGSNTAENRLESVLNDLRKLVFGPATSGTATGDRNGFYAGLNQLSGWLTERTAPLPSLEVMSGLTPTAIAERAKAGTPEGAAYRYALRELNPFVIVGDNSIYAQHNAGGNLDLANWDPAYTEARAGMLAALVAANLADDADGSGATGYYDDTTGLHLYGEGPEVNISFAREAGGRTLAGTSIGDRFFGGAGDDGFRGYAGDDIAYGGGGDDAISGGEGSDQLYGGTGADWLGFLAQGFDQADQAEIGVAGAAGNTYDGGTGNDVINGSAGYDTYVFRKGDGDDYVITNGGTDALMIESGATTPLTAADVKFTRQGYNLVVWLGEPGVEASDSVTVQGWFSATNAPAQLGLVVLQDTVVQQGTPAQAVAWAPSQITALALTVQGSDDPMTSDNLVGLGGFSNSLYGHAGNDTLAGTSVTGYTGVGDKYVGGLGNDILIGTSVSDRYVYAAGDGNDTIYESAGTSDVLQLMGIASTQMTVSRQGYDLRIAFTAGDGGAVDIKNWYLGSTYKIESFEFTDKTMTASQVEALNAYLVGTDGVDTLTALSGVASQMFGLGGNDTLAGGTLADVIDGGDGDDMIYGAYGNDTLIGGAGNDTIYGGSKPNYPSYDDSGNTIIGGTGNDTLYGNNHSDTYVFNLGDGQDTISEDLWVSGVSATDTLQFGAGIAAADIQIVRSGTSLVLKHSNGIDQVTINSWYSSTGGQYKIEQVVFADDTTLSGTSEIEALVAEFWGTSSSETLTAAGNIHTLIGNKGNDTLTGSLLADVFRFNFGDGQDTVNTGDTAGHDILVFEDSFAATTLTASKSGDNLLLTAGSGDKVTMTGWFSTGNQASIQLPGNNLVSAATITNFLTTEGNPNSLRIL